MERLRAELLRRARSEGQGDVEQGMTETTSQVQPMAETTTSRTNGGRFGLLPLQLPALPQLFSSRRRPARQTENEIESPKSPDFVSRRPPTLPPMHLDFSSLADSFGPNANATRAPPTTGHPSLVAPSSIYSQDPPTLEQPARPSPAARIETVRSASAGSINTPDPAEAELARLGIDGRRRHERQQRRRDQAGGYGSERSRKSKPPTRFLFCFPWVKSRRMRSQILRCFVSGTFLLVLLSVCEYSTLPHRAFQVPPMAYD
jgi:hypothetical protein